MSKYLNSCLHYLVNDYQEQLSEQESLVRLKDSALATNKHCLLDAKSNLLRYIVSGGNNTEAIELFNKIIVEQESKQLRNLQQVHKKSNSFAIIKSKNFEMKPKYFHTTTTKPELLKKLKIKDRELGKLRKLQQTIDECSRYRSWSLSQRELQEDRKQQLAQQRLASRECLYQIMENTTPRRVRSSLKQTADYTEEIRRLEQEILALEKQLKTLY